MVHICLLYTSLGTTSCDEIVNVLNGILGREKQAPVSCFHDLAEPPTGGETVSYTHLIQQEIRKREHYEKPSVRRKKKSEAARKRKYN